MSEDLGQKTSNALEFVEKLFFEVSYLIKEVEGQLQGEPEEFMICRSGGYAITSRTSSGLEPYAVEMWMPKKITVFFCESSMTDIQRGITITPFKDGLKIVILHIELRGKDLSAPRVLAGCIRDIKPKDPKEIKKFEKLLWIFSYHPTRVFADLPKFKYEDVYTTFTGEMIEVPLFSLNDSADVVKKLIAPVMRIYRK